MSRLTDTGRCLSPSGEHAFEDGTCPRCGAVEPAPVRHVSTDDLLPGDQATRSTHQPPRRGAKKDLKVAATAITVLEVDVEPTGPQPADRYRWLLIEGVTGTPTSYAALRNQTWEVTR